MALLTPVALPELADLGPVHFIAIGGSGMNGIAAMMLASGVPVSGSDRQDSKYLRSLEAAGPGCTWGTGPSSWAMPGRSYSSAIREDNPELAEARRRGLRVLQCRTRLVDAGPAGDRGGTHGKTRPRP